MALQHIEAYCSWIYFLERDVPWGSLAGNGTCPYCCKVFFNPPDSVVSVLCDCAVWPTVAGWRCAQLELLRAEHAECAERRSALESRQAESADNQARLDSQLSDTYQQLAETRGQLSEARAQLAEARAQLAETLCGQEEVHSQVHTYTVGPMALLRFIKSLIVRADRKHISILCI